MEKEIPFLPDVTKGKSTVINLLLETLIKCKDNELLEKKEYSF